MQQHRKPAPADGTAGLLGRGGEALAIRMTGTALAYLMIVACARIMDESAFGWFSLAMTVAMLASCAGGLGQPVAILRFWPEHVALRQPDRALVMLRACMGLTLVGGLGASILLVALGEAGRAAGLLDAPAGLFPATAALAFAMVMAEFAASALRARERIAAALIPRDIVWRIMVVAAVAWWLARAEPVEAVSALWFVAAALAACVLPQLLWLDISRVGSARPLGPTDGGRFRRTWRALWAVSVLAPAASQGGAVIVGLILSIEAAGLYFAVERTAQLLSFVLIAAAFVATPVIGRHYHGADVVLARRIFTQSCLCSGGAALIGYALFIACGERILSAFDPRFVDGYTVLLILGAASVVNAATGPAGLVLMVTGNEHLHLRLSLVFNLTAIMGQLAGGVAFGITGVAVASALVVMARNAVMFACCLNLLGGEQRPAVQEPL